MRVFQITIQGQRKADRDWPLVVEYARHDDTLKSRVESRFAIDKERLRALRNSPRAYGRALGEAVFKGRVRERFVGLRGDERVHILVFVEAEDLRDLRWERLCAPVDAPEEAGWDFLALNPRTPMTLYLPSVIDQRFPPVVKRDLRALVVVASPEDPRRSWGLEPFDVDRAVALAVEALSPISCDVLASRIGEAARPTLETITARLVAAHYPLLHVVCHGKSRTIEESVRDESGGVNTLSRTETLLFLEKADGSVDAVRGTRLLERLARLQGARGLPRFAFLASCETAVSVEGTELGGLAQRLVRELGLPAVLAMTEPVEVNLAAALVRQFYPSLYRAGFVDQAFAEAGAVLAGREGVNVPVLYSRLGGSPLFGERDRDPRPDEILKEIDTVADLLEKRAPVLLPAWGEAVRALRTHLSRDESSLSDAARRERDRAVRDATDAAGAICLEALDLRFDALVLGESPAPLPHGGRCPFRGLEPYGIDDKDYFFGRRRLIKTLAAKLGAWGFLAVLGPSGSGKTSVVLAGLVPALGAGPGTTAYLRPGADPVGVLEEVLRARGADAKVLVVDQFEELFTLCTDAAQRRAFVGRLLELWRGRRRPIVVTMRADFWGEVAAFPRLRSLMQRRQELVGPMSPAALRRSIEKQAETAGLRFEAGLADTIVGEVTGEPGSMSLLQHALVRLWDRRHGRWLRLDEYLTTGGVRRAIALSADEFYQGLPAEDLRRRARDVFLRLTRVDEDAGPGAEARDTRRRVSYDDLREPGDDPGALERLVDPMEKARLVVTSTNPVTGGKEVEVAHEALIRHWPQLGEWLEAERAGLRLRDGIGRAAREWDGGGRKDEFLVHVGARLREAQKLLKGARLTLNDQERGYLDACRSLSAHRAVYEAEVRIGAARGERHPVELNIPGLGKAWRGELDGRSLGENPDFADPERVGEVLGRALFADEAIGRPFREAVAAVRARGGRLRVRLRVDDEELQDLAWERLSYPSREAWTPLALDPALPFSRYLPGGGGGPPPAVEDRPVKILAVTASPADLDRYGLPPIPAEDRESLRRLLEGLPEVSVRWLESGTPDPPSPAGVRRALADGCHVVHFFAHTRLLPDATCGLFLETDDGGVSVWTSRDLVEAIKGAQNRPSLVVLVGAHSAVLAPPLIRFAGVGAVAATSAPVGLKTLNRFMVRFYPRLLEHGQADQAFNEARGFVRDRHDWHTIRLVSCCAGNRVIAPARAGRDARPGVDANEPLLLRVDLTPAGRFAVELTPPGRLGLEPAEVRVSFEELDGLLGSPDEYGKALGLVLFGDKAVGLPFREAVAAARARGGRLRVRLRVDDAPLRRLAWERVYYPAEGAGGIAWVPLALDPALLFSRYLPGGGWAQPPAVADRPIKVVAVAASPGNLERYRLAPVPAEERAALRSSLEGLPEVSVRWLESGTSDPPDPANLQQALSDGCHILHILAASRSLDSGRDAALFLDGLESWEGPVTVRELAGLMDTAAEPPLLCVLTGPPDPSPMAVTAGHTLADVARTLVELSGVQTAVALSGSDSGRFLREFYRTLFEAGQVDLALGAARRAAAGAVDPALAVSFTQRSDDTILDV